MSTTREQRTRPLLLGHRGARAVKSIPENTFASFDRALVDGCDGFEFDVRLTADGHAVVCHDPAVGSISIARATAGQLPSLPRLGEVLARYREVFLDIELKVAGLEELVVQALYEHSPPRFVVSSFLPEVLTATHDLDAKIPLGLLCETKTQLRRWQRLPVEFVIPHHSLVDEDLVRKLQASGKGCLVWTVNSAREMRKLAAWGIDGIISDDARLLNETLGI